MSAATEAWHQWVLTEEQGVPPEWWDITRRAVAAGFAAGQVAALEDAAELSKEQHDQPDP